MKRIYIVKLGWVLVGDECGSGKDGVTRLENAAVVRRWGTTKGIGELALKGPRQETVLDPCGIVEIQTASTLMSIACDAVAWKGK